MSNCEGRGDCIQQCCCICYEDEEDEVPSEVCSCGHRNHTHLIGGTTEFDVYCQKKECLHNCHLVECHNFRMCGQKRPRNILDCHNEMCSNCAIMIGKIKFLDEKDDCPICLLNKDMIEISCGKHKVCLDCWKNWSKTSSQIPLTCPLCRNPIWK
jgi:hypothetical protein